MSVILHIETSTDVCSVALSKDGKSIYSEIETKGPSHAVQLGVFVDKAMTCLSQQALTLDAVSVSGGPGSYTGLRIGVSMAKGICYALSIPLISIPTLKVLAQQSLDLLPRELAESEDLVLCPMLDARRMEVYTAAYDKHLNEMTPVQALVVDENSFSEWPQNKQLCLMGNGADKVYSVLKRDGLTWQKDLYPRAVDMITLAERAYAEKHFEDTAYYEPFYLKEFQATIPKKMNQLIHNK